MFKVILISAMLISGSAFAQAHGEQYAPRSEVYPPITKYADVTTPTTQPTNFGKINKTKVDQKINEVIKRGK